MGTLRAYLQLCRAANVFTAVADIAAGWFLTHANHEPLSPFLWLVLSSACLYTAGMVFNDLFDCEVDRDERPHRPLPSGRVSWRNALGLGVTLMLVGLGAASAAGVASAVVAGLLTGAIFLYDGGLKRTELGPLGMGACRFFNLLLGASHAAMGDSLTELLMRVVCPPQLHVAMALGLYITGVTWFARHEAGESSRRALLWAWGVINLGLALWLAFPLHSVDPHRRGLSVALLFAMILLSINRRLLVAIADPTPQRVQQSIKTLLFSLVMLDAATVLFAQAWPGYAIAVVALLIPANLLARFLTVT